jgi:hypothetical protein
MRGTLRAVCLFVVMAALGCHHDKYNMTTKYPEAYMDPPDEKRYNEPDTAPYRKPPTPKEDKTLLGRPGSNGIMGAPGL